MKRLIWGVAELVPDRIKRLIYLDAFVPNDGESIKMISGALWDQAIIPKIKDGFVGYPFGPTRTLPPTDVPQPLQTFTEALRIKNPLVLKIPTAYILMTVEGKGGFEQAGASRARARNWKVVTFEGGHYSMRDQTDQLVKKLQTIVE